MVRCFKRGFAIIAMTLVLVGVASKTLAQPAWYYGTVKRIYLYNGGFVMTFNSSALDDCMHKYVYFKDNVLGETTVSRAYSMALTAQASSRLFGAVIDKDINGPGGQCVSNGSTDIKD